MTEHVVRREASGDLTKDYLAGEVIIFHCVMCDIDLLRLALTNNGIFDFNVTCRRCGHRMTGKDIKFTEKFN